MKPEPNKFPSEKIVLKTKSQPNLNLIYKERKLKNGFPSDGILLTAYVT